MKLKIKLEKHQHTCAEFIRTDMWLLTEDGGLNTAEEMTTYLNKVIQRAVARGVELAAEYFKQDCPEIEFK